MVVLLKEAAPEWQPRVREVVESAATMGSDNKKWGIFIRATKNWRQKKTQGKKN